MKPKITFVYENKRMKGWNDGLWSALNVLEKDFHIERVYIKDAAFIPQSDFVLGLGAFGSTVDLRIHDMTCKKGLVVGGNATTPETHNDYDVLFSETDWRIANYIPEHRNVRKAFGVNTSQFKETTYKNKKAFSYIGFGALASWKRWEKMSEKSGLRIVCGQYQEDNEEESLGIARELLKSGVIVSNEVPMKSLVKLINMSERAYIPADINGGGEKAVLEARACNIPVEVEPDNQKLQELVDINPIPTHHDYANKLKQGIMSCL